MNDDLKIDFDAAGGVDLDRLLRSLRLIYSEHNLLAQVRIQIVLLPMGLHCVRNNPEMLRKNVGSEHPLAGERPGKAHSEHPTLFAARK